MKYGTCFYQANQNYQEECFHSWECMYAYNFCMDEYNDGHKRCTVIPTIFFYQGVRWKLTYTNTGCQNYADTILTRYQCNQWGNLICVDTANYGTCLCIDQYYYWNNTNNYGLGQGMCVRGSYYGQTCTSATQCVPTSAGMTCAYPYVGATNTICMCTSGSKYYDLSTQTCLSLKGLNSTCRDNSECSGASTGSMYCGMYFGGGQKVCQCTDAYYTSALSCVAKLAYNVACTSNNQCFGYLNQTCVSNKCGCAAGLYFSSIGSSCQSKKYSRDPCTTGTECWSGTCNSSLCV